jgi:Ca2+-binding RTX toxin-like protein
MARRISVFMVAGALLLVLVAGVAVARTFQCTDIPCNGTNDDDIITERQGSLRDEISGRDGRDVIRAQEFGNDNDILNGDQRGDRLRSDDNDDRDAVDCGSGNDTAIVDEGDAVNFSNCEDVRGTSGGSPPRAQMVPADPSVDVSDAVLAE